jgi:repressor LexA
MIEVGIYHRDLILVRQQPDADNGDIVVALLDDTATVKTFYREANSMCRLQPENPAFEPIYSNNVKVLGKVIALFRKL